MEVVLKACFFLRRGKSQGAGIILKKKRLMAFYPVPTATKVSLWMIRRSRGWTTRRGLAVVPVTGVFEQQLKLSDAVSHVPGQTCPGTATLPCNWLQVFDPSSVTGTCDGVGKGVSPFAAYWVGTGVAGAGCTSVLEVHPATRRHRIRSRTVGSMKQEVRDDIRVHRSGLQYFRG